MMFYFSLKTELALEIQHICYFSDGCAGQYKNCKHFINLCHLKTDFGISCTWNFFATSHSKSPCDGIGGTIKHLTVRASLQCPIKDQILTMKNLFEFCNLEIKGIKFVHLHVTSKELDITRAKLKDLYALAKTIPGTRSMHQFILLSEQGINAKCVSEDDKFYLKFDFIKITGKCLISLKVSDFIVCKYNHHF